MLRHFVVTRLGLGIYNERWYEQALNAFESITFPSLSRQTSQEFDWLITVDSEIPATARERVERLLEGHSNYHIVCIDLMQLRRLCHGGLDWVFEPCRDYILETGLLVETTDYVITSMIDADDAWRLDVVATINATAVDHIPAVGAAEDDRAHTVRHTGGLAITLPLGWEWFVPSRAVRSLWSPFLATAVFVVHRFSAGISALSIRHHQWAAYADIVEFKRIELMPDQAMWIYSRHGHNTTPWNSDRALPVNAAMTETLRDRFGIDIEKANRLLAVTGKVESVGAHAGQQKQFTAQHDRLYRIAALNRQIDLLERASVNGRTRAGGGPERPVLDLISRKKYERAALIEQFRSAGQQ